MRGSFAYPLKITLKAAERCPFQDLHTKLALSGFPESPIMNAIKTEGNLSMGVVVLWVIGHFEMTELQLIAEPESEEEDINKPIKN